MKNRGFPGGSDGKQSACNAGDPGLTPGWGRAPGGGQGNLLQYFCLENPHGQRSLAGYSPRGRKESDTTELLSTGHMKQLKLCLDPSLNPYALPNPTSSFLTSITVTIL